MTDVDSDPDGSARRDRNRAALFLLAPTLIAAGAAGFLRPKGKAPTSAAPAYNAFHIIFGALGLACAASGRSKARAFNLGFGAFDLYQAVASRRGWFPQRWFRWKLADDLLHVAIGGALVAVALAPSSQPSEQHIQGPTTDEHRV
jgi:hypothetical protein